MNKLTGTSVVDPIVTGTHTTNSTAATAATGEKVIPTADPQSRASEGAAGAKRGLASIMRNNSEAMPKRPAAMWENPKEMAEYQNNRAMEKAQAEHQKQLKAGFDAPDNGVF